MTHGANPKPFRGGSLNLVNRKVTHLGWVTSWLMYDVLLFMTRIIALHQTLESQSGFPKQLEPELEPAVPGGGQSQKWLAPLKYTTHVRSPI